MSVSIRRSLFVVCTAAAAAFVAVGAHAMLAEAPHKAAGKFVPETEELGRVCTHCMPRCMKLCNRFEG